MGMQQTKWWNFSGEKARRLGMGVGVCSTVFGLIYMVAPSGISLAPIETNVQLSADNVEPPAVPVVNKLASVAVEPPAELAVAAIDPVPLPEKVLPLARPVTPSKQAALRVKTVRTETAMASTSGVETYDRCMPQCETRDPLIVGYPEPVQYPAGSYSSASNEPQDKFSRSPMQQAGNLLSKAAAAPGVALRKGRDMLGSVGRIIW
jgi:hypothetical protein